MPLDSKKSIKHIALKFKVIKKLFKQAIITWKAYGVRLIGVLSDFSRNNVMNLIHGPILVYTWKVFGNISAPK